MLVAVLPNIAGMRAKVDVAVFSAFVTRGNGHSKQVGPVVLCDCGEGQLTGEFMVAARKAEQQYEEADLCD